MQLSPYRLALILCLLLFAATAAPVSSQLGPGATWTPKVNLSEGLGVQCSYKASVAVDVSGTAHVIWGECASGEDNMSARSIYYRFLKDGAWSAPVDVIAAPDGKAIDSSALQATADGRLHIVWVIPVGYLQYETYYTWAPIEEAGSARAWAAPRLVDTSGNSIDFKADDAGALRVLYTSNDPAGVFLATSRDLGRTWLRVRIYPQPVDEVRLAVNDNGSLHAVWQRDDNGGRTLATIYYARSTDDGKTWSEPFTIDRKGSGDERYTEAYRPNYPSIATSGADQVHIVWDGAPSGQRWHRWSADNGLTWSDPVQLDPLMRAITWYSPLVVDSLGVVHMVTVGHDWTKEGAGGVWYAWWDPGGRAWTRLQLIDNQYQNDYHEAGAAVGLGNKIYAVFEDHRASSTGGGEFDIWFMEGRTRAPALPAQTLPSLKLLATPASVPTPEQATEEISVAVPAPLGARAPQHFVEPVRAGTSAVSPAMTGILAVVAVLLIAALLSQRGRRA